MESENTNSYSGRPLWQKILLYVVIGGIIYALVYYFVFYKKNNSYVAPANTQSSYNQQPTSTTTNENESMMNEGMPPEESPMSGEESMNSENESMMESTIVTYTSSGFSPKTVTIKKGESVTWTNDSSNDMWVASDVHPIHSDYDNTTLREHCNGATSSSFDQCGTGDSYTFTFDKVGTWKYHNHVRASDVGTVIVE